MARSQTQYLADIDKAMTDAQRFAEGHTLEEFRKDRQLRYSIERTLEIIGEATSNLSDEVKARDETLPWREMRGCATSSLTPTTGLTPHAYGESSPRTCPEHTRKSGHFSNR